jgi:toxin ParE1/3/4
MQVVWTRAALSDIDDIQDYIAQESPAAAYSLAMDLYSRTNQLLAKAPMAGRTGRARGTRELVFADMAYIVAYRVTGRVEILAVVHAAREWPESFD